MTAIQTGVAMSKTKVKHHDVYAVDMDKTLAVYHKWSDSVGEPIMPMVNRVKALLAEGKKVAIFTARVAEEEGFTPEAIAEQRRIIEEWCVKHLGQKLPVTAVKSRHFVQFFDDRAVGVVPNEGTIIGPEREPQEHPFPNGVPR